MVLDMRWRCWLLAGLLAYGGAGWAAEKKHATVALPDVPETLTPAQADAFLAKLTDAQVRALLARQLHANAEKRATPAPAEAAERGLGPMMMDVAEKLEAARMDAGGERKNVVQKGMAELGGAVSSGVTQVFAGGAALQLALLALALLGGATASLAVRRALRAHGLEPSVSADATPGPRITAAVLRFVLDLLPFGAFAVIALALMHAFTGAATPTRTFVAVYVTGAILMSAAAVLLRLVLAPRWAPLRPLPLHDDAARFLYRWLLAISAVMVFGPLSAELLLHAGVPREAGLMLTVIAGSAAGLTLIAMIVAARPLVAASGRLPALLVRAWPYFAIGYVLLVWLLWAGALLDGQASPAGAAVASLGILLAFPLLDYWVGRAIADVVGQAEDKGTLRRQTVGQPLRWAMRVLLAVLLVTAVGELWDFQYFEWQARLRQALLSASFDLVAAFAVAVLGWQFIKVAIDRRLVAHEVDGVRIEPSQRLRTLLPLARVFLVTALIVTTVMLVLSGLGINIGPLLAGAGIVGLAIGFGAQTLVRDIITGVFLIMDDAFRVGEYIQSGNYKGTVESIGLRSVKLRHHRGPIYVVPFGELRGVQNLARDWVIHKFTIGLTYDSDLEKARKLVKKVGQQLADDPEYKDTILEPLKMQGVEEFGDFAIQVRMKMMTKPGDKQFAIKRKAHAMIKKSFDEHGIKFAFPTVQVAGGGEAAIAAAATRLPSIAGEQAA